MSPLVRFGFFLRPAFFSGLCGVFIAPLSAASKRALASLSLYSPSDFLFMGPKMSSRGKPKRKLRSLITEPPGEKEESLWAGGFDDHTPIAAAIIGCVMVEHQLETLLRDRLRNSDDSTWSALTDSNGPMSTLTQKIMMGYALGLFDENDRFNLNILKNIRNVFAHTKKVVDFDHELIVKELNGIKVPKAIGHKRELTYLKKVKHGGRHSFIGLCYVLHSILIRRQIKSLKAKGRYMQKKLESKKSGWARLLASNQPLSNSLESNWLLSRAYQSGGPNPPIQGGLLAGLSGMFAGPPSSEEIHKSDKKK